MTKIDLFPEDDLLKPSITPLVKIVDGFMALTGVIFLAVWAIGGGVSWLVGAALVWAFLVLAYVGETRRIAEDNQKRLDFLIRNR